MTPLDLVQLEHEARQRLDPGVYDFFAGGADDELTMAANEEAWSRRRLRPRVLRDVSSVDTATTLLGAEVAAPIVVAPVAYQRLVHPDGEAAMAAGAAASNALVIVSMRTSTPVEVVAAALDGSPWWLQVYLLRDRARSLDIIDRARAHGCRAIVLTGDAPVLGRKRRNERNGWELPATHALAGSDEGAMQDPAVTFADITMLADRTGLPVVVKGVLRADDAVAAVDAGARGIAVSNHGGRQLDTAVAAADALAEVVDAVGSRAEIYVDGGVRRGTDVVKALAIGARAVLVGRPVIWGLVVDGAAGVTAVLDGLRAELERAMALCGTPTLADLTGDLLA